MVKLDIEKLYKDGNKIIITAHRGFSYQCPENTLMAFEKAAELGVDMIEFDLRGSKDNVPVVLHDATLDRTSNATGKPSEYTLRELKKYNFSHWDGYQGEGVTLEESKYDDVTIPTFEELLETVPTTIGLNIQLYETHDILLKEICHLYDKYDVYGRGYLTVDTFEEGDRIRHINPDIELCVLHNQVNMKIEDLKAIRDYGCKYIQPYYPYVDESFCKHIRDLDLYANMFFSNTHEDNVKYIKMGMKGLLTDCPHILKKTLNELGLR